MRSAAARPSAEPSGYPAERWSLTIIALDVIALYGLCVYGSRENMTA